MLNAQILAELTAKIPGQPRIVVAIVTSYETHALLFKRHCRLKGRSVLFNLISVTPLTYSTAILNGDEKSIGKIYDFASLYALKKVDQWLSTGESSSSTDIGALISRYEEEYRQVQKPDSPSQSHESTGWDVVPLGEFFTKSAGIGCSERKSI